MNGCIFCKIVSGEIPSAKVWENNNFLAFLDANPNTKGMTLVVTKVHNDSYLFDLSDRLYSELLLVSKKVAGILEKTLNVKRVAMVMEGTGINHIHIKLYPLHGLAEKFVEMWAPDRVYFEKYEGYLSTKLGPRVENDELEKLAAEIREKSGL